MKQVDYIVVGLGVAATAFIKYLLEHQHSFVVINQDFHRASTVAAGLYNPVVLKRFSLVWDARQQLEKMHELFLWYEQFFNKKFIDEMPVFRIFNDEQEQKTWHKKATTHHELVPFLSTDFQQLKIYNDIKDPYGSGEVLATGRIDLRLLIPTLEQYLRQKENLLQEKFRYEDLQIAPNSISYQNLQAKHVIFCEGYHILSNPYFRKLPIIGVKGEVLTIRTEAKLPKAVVKGKEFLFPLSSDEYFVGATYDRDCLDYEVTESAKTELLSGIGKVVDSSFMVLHQQASIRPTVKDRRPIIGGHPTYKNLYCFNGMGTRGTMLAPKMAEILYLHIEKGQPIDNQSDIARFYDEYFD